MKVNTKLLDLVTIYNNHKLGDLLDLYNLINDIKFDMEVCLKLLKEDFKFDPSPNPERAAEYEIVSNQLYYAKENLKIIEKAILCHEYNVFETLKIRGVLVDICLN
jgi:hypothetical protein